jgi:hypothetical protein
LSLSASNSIQLIVVDQYPDQKSVTIKTLFGAGAQKDSTNHATKVIWAIIAATAVLILAGIAFFVYFRSKSNGADNDTYGELDAGAEKTILDNSQNLDNFRP